jgi:hypothetical protein
MTAHRPAMASAVVIPLVPHAEADTTTVEAERQSFITELTTAMGHLEKALELSRTPARFLLPTGATVTATQLHLWVAQHTAQAQTLLDQITAHCNNPQI